MVRREHHYLYTGQPQLEVSPNQPDQNFIVRIVGNEDKQGERERNGGKPIKSSYSSQASFNNMEVL